MTREKRRPAAGGWRARGGVALVAAVALLALSAALLAGAFAAGRAMMQSARTTRAMARAETGAQHAIGEVLSGWRAQYDSLAVGGFAEPSLAPEPLAASPALVRRARVLRITDRVYVISVDVRAFEWAMPIAQRRVRLVLERPVPIDSTAPLAVPVPISRWSVAGLY